MNDKADHLANEEQIPLKIVKPRRKGHLPQKLIYEQTPIGIAMIDSINGRIYEVNQRFAKAVLRPTGELAEKNYKCLIHPDDIQEFLENIALMNKGKINGFTTEKRFLRPDGSVVWTRLTVTPIKGKGQKNPLHLCILEDMTSQKNEESKANNLAIQYRSLFEYAQDGIMIVDFTTGLIQDVNPFLINLFGYSSDDYIGKHIWEISSVISIPATKALFESLLDKRVIRSEYLQWKSVTGKMVDIEFDASTYKVAGTTTIQCILRDVTARRQVERVFLNKKRLVETTMNSIGDGVIATDCLGMVTSLNRAGEFLTGWSEEEAIGNSVDTVFSISNHQAGTGNEDIVKEVLEYGIPQELAAHTYLVSKQGPEHPIEACTAPIIHETGEKIGVVIVFRDTADKELQKEKIEYLCYHDQLTGLYNRRFYEEELQRLDKERNLPLTVAMGDINGLKLVNDSFGHVMGDNLLKKAAEVIRRCCRADDIIARQGGDEFVIILPKTSPEQAGGILLRIVESASREHIKSVVLSISFGHATKGNVDSHIGTVLKNAEEDMYRNKLYESASMRSQTIGLIMNALYEKSNREKMHALHVSQLCEAIAEKMSFDKTDVIQLRTAGLMHDIGKVTINQAVLNGNQGLNDREWKEIKRLPEVGYRILNSVNEFSDIARFVLEHHERWDGLGYPKGLKGDEISLQARIIAVADSYDAMTSDREYRKVFSKDEALGELRRCSSSQFDPKVVSSLLQMNLN